MLKKFIWIKKIKEFITDKKSFLIIDFFQIFLISRSTEILIELNFWLGRCVRYILKKSVSIQILYSLD